MQYGEAIAAIEAEGEDSLIMRIAEGATQAELAGRLGVGVGSLNNWLHKEPERSGRAREAMRVSAEAWLDRGLKALNDALPDNAEIARARAIEQHCARRAAIRDPKRYGDKLQTEVTGSLKHDHTVGLSAETAELLAGLKAGPSDSGDAAAVPD